MSIRAQVISFLIKRTLKSRMAELDDVAAFREQMAGGGLSPAIPDDVKVSPVEAGGVPAEWVSYGQFDSARVLLYLHGGGYVFGSPDSHRDLAWRLGEAAGIRVLVLD